MLKYANKIAVQELVKQATWLDSMRDTASKTWNGIKGAVGEGLNAAGNGFGLAGNAIREGWNQMTGDAEGARDARRAAAGNWDRMWEHGKRQAEHMGSAIANGAMTGAGLLPGGFGLHASRGALMEQNKNKPAEDSSRSWEVGYQTPPGGGLNDQFERDQEAIRKMRQTPGIAEAPAAAPKPAQAPVAAPKTQPAPAAPAPAAQGGLRLTDMGGPGLWNPSLTATQVNQNAGDPFADSFTMRGINPGLISTINQPASNGGGFDPSKITQADMNKWRHITGARNMNSEMDKWKTYEAMNGRGRQATNAAFRQARSAGYR